ncbi:hypothetical protein C8J38_1293 [Rhizobium sp. PP-WC-2G-219]|nr:hypothetical protein C8J38_1293 [Rhizobium sp. PP-WC-2G-219]
MRRYIITWESALAMPDESAFTPQAYVAQDLSAAIYRDCPCIFMGTNQWAVKASQSADELSDSYAAFYNRVCYIRDHYPNSKVIVTIVPEKDYLIDRLFFRTGTYDGIDHQLNILAEKLTHINATLSFFDPLTDMEQYQSLGDFIYPDSHLPARNYLQILAYQLTYLGINWSEVESSVKLYMREEYCDLSEKFLGMHNAPYNLLSPNFANADVKLIGGNETFQVPLGDTKQAFVNSNPILDDSVLILGDSHSSIFSSRKMTYSWACIARETEFYWNPCGVRSDGPPTQHGIVVMEISLRFV